MTAPQQAAVEEMVFRKTNAHAGRHVSITPGNSSMRHLAQPGFNQGPSGLEAGRKN